ncbi:MAG: AAA family ATPase, partial [Candidatus Fibromonas sp.]|nr:AAA family ATPase [Candidatus Fibromonas sp.]
MLRKLPLSGVQTFADVINDFAVYVDKTAYVHKMISNYKSVFFARPRRFGKSLTCSTLKAIFENKRDLFKGLAIEALPWEWKEYPVVHLDMSAANFMAGKERLIELLNGSLKFHAEKYDVSLQSQSVSEKFKELLKALYAIKGKVAIIIDEYDCPLLDTLDRPEIHSDIKEELRGFYKVLKECDQCIQFVFITGVTKFSQVSLFSGMNQPEDISLSTDYAALCGFTQSELETYFDLEINEYSKKFGG